MPHTVRMRHKRRAKASQGLPKALAVAGLVASGLISLLGALAAFGLGLAYASLADGLPSPENLTHLLEPPDGLLLQPTRLYDRSGEHVLLALENPAASGREYLPLGEVAGAGPGEAGTGDRDGKSLAPTLVAATLAAADPDFWEHPGFYVDGLLQGAHPTLAQRLVSDLLLWDEPSGLRRAVRERLLAAQITSRFGRARILEWYLNSADYGSLAYGADAAARAYLGKPATELSLAEAALLAAASQEPALNPAATPGLALELKDRVLASMLERGFITSEEFSQASQEEIALSTPVEPPVQLAPAFTALVLEDLAARIDPSRLQRGGLRVVTSLDYDLQVQASCAAATQLARLEGSGTANIPAAGDAACLAARLLPALPSTLDGLSGEGSQVAASLVALEPASGQVLAMVGENTPGLNPAQPPGRPPGTLLTPFIYLSAFSRGWSPGSLAWDIPTSLPESLAGLQNPDGQYHGPLSLRTALANDYLVPAAQLLEGIGAEGVWQVAQQLGMVSLAGLDREAARQLPFEGGSITLLEATQAYGGFASGGVLAGIEARQAPAGNTAPPVHPVTTLQVASLDGQLWLDCQKQLGDCSPSTRPVISAQLAYLITHVLSDEPARWPSLGHPNLLEIGRPAGAKLGRTQAGSDVWTVGYTPRLALGVWIGSREPGADMGLPATAAAGLWHAVIKYAIRNEATEGWRMPPGISRLRVCDPSGLLPTKECPAVVTEVFLHGSEPAHVDNLFRTFRINRETGRLATAFTPQELVEERVYLIVPPQAGAWARAAGLALPPEDYDTIAVLQTGAGEAEISSPAMFASVNGTIEIWGTASGESFHRYRVQVGQGLNPYAWLALGEDHTEPVSEGLLATWDTADLAGLYTVQLLVVDHAGSVQTATLQVTVDNQPPEVAIRAPMTGQRFAFPEQAELILHVEASDDLELASLQLYVDGQLVAEPVVPPYLVTWRATPGKHILMARATDRAGNHSEAQVEFVVER